VDDKRMMPIVKHCTVKRLIEIDREQRVHLKKTWLDGVSETKPFLLVPRECTTLELIKNENQWACSLCTFTRKMATKILSALSV